MYKAGGKVLKVLTGMDTVADDKLLKALLIITIAYAVILPLIILLYRKVIMFFDKGNITSFTVPATIVLILLLIAAPLFCVNTTAIIIVVPIWLFCILPFCVACVTINIKEGV